MQADQLVLVIIITLAMSALVGVFAYSVSSRLQRQSSSSTENREPVVVSGSLTSSDFLRQRCKELEKKDSERKILLSLIKAVSASNTFDSLVRGIIDCICKELGTRLGALLWLNRNADRLTFRFVKGYDIPENFTISSLGSVAGLSLQERAPVTVSVTQKHRDYTPVKNTNETNLVCIPLSMFGDWPCVLRFANFDTKLTSAQELKDIFSNLIPFLSATFEMVLLSQENGRRKNQLAAISTITSSLHKTLDIKEIFLTTARALKPVFNYSYYNVYALAKENSFEPICSVPREIVFDCGPARSRLILRNICEKNEPVFIENINDSDVISGDNKEIRSIMTMPIIIDDSPAAYMIIASPRTTAFNAEDMPVLKMMSEQVALTISRAIHFRRQEERAVKDGLTSLYNRAYFNDIIKQEWERWTRYKRPFSLLMLDVDHFKKCNDNYGHQIGDIVLKVVASVLKNSLRTVDCACRYGGEEFVVILRETTLDGAIILAKRLNKAIASRAIPTSKGDIHVTISIGLADVNKSVKTENELIGLADKALYHSKENGRDRVSVSNAEIISVV